VNLPERAHVRR